MQNKPILEFCHVNKFYGDKKVLNSISFSVYPNEIIALLGVNGAGKTTAIQIMLGQQLPTTGSVTLFGKNPKHYNSRYLVGTTPQNVEFPEGIKTKEALSFVRDHYKSPYSIRHMVDSFELSSFLEEKSSKLSGGQKRRLALALAFIGNPQVIFLDEPTTGLDVGARKILWEFVKNQSKSGKTIFLTTHYLEEIEQVASRVLFLQDGQIKIDGTVDAIKKSATTSVVKVVFETDINFDFTQLQNCQKFSKNENKVILETSQCDQLIVELVQKNIPFKNLGIERENLESAFLNLSQSK